MKSTFNSVKFNNWVFTLNFTLKYSEFLLNPQKNDSNRNFDYYHNILP